MPSSIQVDWGCDNVVVTILVVEIIPVGAIVIKSHYHDDGLDYKTTGHNNLPTMPIITVKHTERLLIYHYNDIFWKF